MVSPGCASSVLSRADSTCIVWRVGTRVGVQPDCGDGGLLEGVGVDPGKALGDEDGGLGRGSATASPEEST